MAACVLGGEEQEPNRDTVWFLVRIQAKGVHMAEEKEKKPEETATKTQTGRDDCPPAAYSAERTEDGPCGGEGGGNPKTTVFPTVSKE